MPLVLGYTTSLHYYYDTNNNVLLATQNAQHYSHTTALLPNLIYSGTCELLLRYHLLANLII